jgi:hypothetical protein
MLKVTDLTFQTTSKRLFEKSIWVPVSLEDPPQPPLKRGEPDPEVPLFKGDLGGSSRVYERPYTFQTTSN